MPLGVSINESLLQVSLAQCVLIQESLLHLYSSGVTEEEDEEEEEEEDEDLSDLLLHFHKLHVGDGPLCEKHFDRPVGIMNRDIQ